MSEILIWSLIIAIDKENLFLLCKYMQHIANIYLLKKLMHNINSGLKYIFKNNFIKYYDLLIQ